MVNLTAPPIAAKKMKGINSLGQALESGGFAPSWAPRGGVFHLAFPALAREWNHQDASTPLASFGNKKFFLFIEI